MGRYTRKPKSTLAIIEPSNSHLSVGVRTRAKTLALQKLQAMKTSSTQTPETELSYLQLRSRRLEKSPWLCCRQPNPNPNGEGGEEKEEGCFGDNSLEFRGSSTWESTPCSSTKDFNIISTPGSSSSTRSTNQKASNHISSNCITRNMPLAREIEEFFAVHEQEQQRRFADKYNFNFVSEKVLEGSYEWVKVESQ